MDFELSVEQKILKDMAAEFAQREVEPLAAKIDREDRFPPELYRKMAENGLLCMTVPEESGGPGVDMVSYCLVLEELAAASAAVANLNLLTMQMAEFMLRFGSDHHRNLVGPLLRGEQICAISLTEPDAGSDAGSLKTTAVRQGNYYVLNGTKAFVTAGTMADYALIFARTEPGAGNKGISVFLVDTQTPGFSRGRKEELMGIRGLGTCGFVLEDCVVPASALIGEENRGFKQAMLSINTGRIVIATLALGVARRALQEALTYAENRHQFGRPIADFQAVQVMLADMAAGISAVRVLIHKAAWLKDQSKDYSTEASQAKLLATDLSMKAATDALQIHGAYGYTKQYVVERLFRDANCLRSMRVPIRFSG